MFQRLLAEALHEDVKHGRQRIRRQIMWLRIVGPPLFDEVAEPLTRAHRSLLALSVVRAVVDGSFKPVQHDLAGRSL